MSQIKNIITFLLVRFISAKIIFSETFDDNNPLKQFVRSLSGTIEKCPNSTSNCLHFNKKVQGGDLITTDIYNPALNEPLYVEFQYFTDNPNKSITEQNSSLVVGFTDSSISKIYWVAMGDLKNQKEKEDYAIEIIDQNKKWKLVRFMIKPFEIPYFRLVFQDYLNISSTPGQYYINNIAVTHTSNCNEGCELCASALYCDKCAQSYFGTNNGQCVKKICLEGLEKLRSNQSVSLDKLSDQIFITFHGYDPNCLPLKISSINNQGLYSAVTRKILNSSTVSFTPNCNQDICEYQLIIEQTTQTFFKYTFYSNGKPKANDFNLSFPALTIAVEAKLEFCISDPCEFQQYDLINVQVFEFFQVKLAVVNNAFKNWKVKQGSIKMIRMGSNLPISYQQIDNSVPGEIIYTIALPLATAGEMTLIVSGQLVPNGRVLLEDSDKRVMTQQFKLNVSEEFTQPPCDTNPSCPGIYDSCCFEIRIILGFIFMSLLLQ